MGAKCWQHLACSSGPMPKSAKPSGFFFLSSPNERLKSFWNISAKSCPARSRHEGGIYYWPKRGSKTLMHDGSQGDRRLQHLSLEANLGTTSIPSVPDSSLTRVLLQLKSEWAGGECRSSSSRSQSCSPPSVDTLLNPPPPPPSQSDSSQRRSACVR
jgi:hypothetical protein